MAVRVIVDSLPALQFGAGSTHLARRDMECAADVIGLVDQQGPGAALGGADGGGQPGGSRANDDDVVHTCHCLILYLCAVSVTRGSGQRKGAPPQIATAPQKDSKL